MKKYLITGGAGFIGTALTTSLLEKKHFVRVLDNELRGSHTRLKKSERLEFFTGDIRHEKNVMDACKGIDSIIHLAFVNGTRYFYEQPELVLDVGIKGMLNVLRAAQEHAVPELFLASSSEVYQTPPIIPTPEDVPFSIPDPKNPRYSYAGGKIISELLTIHHMKHFKRVIIFRPHNVYGPAMGYEHVIPELITKMTAITEKKHDFPIQGSGKETRAFIYVDDFIQGVLLLLQKGVHGEIYNIGTRQEIAIQELAATLAKLMKKKIRLVRIPLQQGSVKRRCPDISKIVSLGFTPQTSFEEGLQKTVQWYTMDASIVNEATEEIATRNP